VIPRFFFLFPSSSVLFSPLRFRNRACAHAAQSVPHSPRPIPDRRGSYRYMGTPLFFFFFPLFSLSPLFPWQAVHSADRACQLIRPVSRRSRLHPFFFFFFFFFPLLSSRRFQGGSRAYQPAQRSPFFLFFSPFFLIPASQPSSECYRRDQDLAERMGSRRGK